jgi:uncharacterized repeat protein (TIGR02543 family)
MKRFPIIMAAGIVLLLLAFSPVYAAAGAEDAAGTSLQNEDPVAGAGSAIITDEEYIRMAKALDVFGIGGEMLVDVLYDHNGAPAYLLGWTEKGYLIWKRDIAEGVERAEGQNPYNGMGDGKKYYGGVLCYYVKTAKGLADGLTGGIVDNMEYNPGLDDIPSQASAGGIQALATATGPKMLPNYVNYVERLSFGNNNNDTCTAVATQIALNYINLQFPTLKLIDAKWKSENLRDNTMGSTSYSKTNAFHKYLYTDLNISPGAAGALPWQVDNGIEIYRESTETLRKTKISANSFVYASLTGHGVADQIDAGKPVLLHTQIFLSGKETAPDGSVKDLSDYRRHSMVAYGYQVDSSGLVWLCVHTGWDGKYIVEDLAKGGFAAKGVWISQGSGSFVTAFSYRDMEHSVYFNINDGTFATSPSITVKEDGTYGTLPTPTRTGYTFDGWYTAASGGTNITSAAKVTITENQTLWAHWTIKKYTITFNASGGSAASSIAAAYNSAIGTLPASTRSGYTFGGWYTAASGGTRIATTTKVTANITYYAHWIANMYTVTFNANGGNVFVVEPQTKTVTYGAAHGTLPTPIRVGYTFSGWYTSTAYASQITAATVVSFAGSRTLYAKWTIIKYTITFNANGGNAVSSMAVPYNSAIGTLPTTARTGYTFNGWYTAASGGMKIAATVKATANKTYYAQWTAKKYTITLNVNGGNALTALSQTKTVTYGAAHGTLPAPTRTGYSFSGWYTSTSFTSQITASTVVSFAGSRTLYAKWTKK